MQLLEVQGVMKNGLLKLVPFVDVTEARNASGVRRYPQPSVSFINFSRCSFQTAALVCVP
jgi:hypothetical protein